MKNKSIAMLVVMVIVRGRNVPRKQTIEPIIKAGAHWQYMIQKNKSKH